MSVTRRVLVAALVVASVACLGSNGGGGGSTPNVSPVGGSYASGLVVTITAPSTDAVVYYTTDGSEPDNSQSALSQYFAGGSRAVTILASTTVKAFAVMGGVKSPTVSATYAITPPLSAPTAPDFAAGFTAVRGQNGDVTSSVQMNGDAVLSGTRLQLTQDATAQVTSAFFVTPVNVQTFTTSFAFQLSADGPGPIADGITFTVQGMGPFAIGSRGGGLGYGPDPLIASSVNRIDRSVAVKFDPYNDSGEGNNSIGVYTNGASPTVPADSLPAGLDLKSGHIFSVQIAYAATTLTVTLTDDSSPDPKPTFTKSYPVDIPTTVGGNTAYVGFTGATGGNTSRQEILSWTYTN